jgi:hypothetical protein
MRTLNKFFTICATAFLFMLMTPHKSMAQDNGYVSDQEFYDNLQNYGTWVQDDQYGNVWIPDVDGDFRPYATNGYWVQTDYGTTWVSDYPWGWATFHYGRWRYDDYYGWEWIPGHEWAPAWVTWRQGAGYYGWAPMQPGISISITLGGGYYVPDRYWVCAPQAYITSRYINRYYVPNDRVVTIVHNTTYIHNTYIYNNRTYITGPKPRDIEQVTHKRVTVYRIGNADRPGATRVDRNVINIYHPEIKVSADARPTRVVNARAYRAANPHDGIGSAGATFNMHTNAAKLAATARSNNPKVVHVNPAPVTHPDLPGGHKNIGAVTPGQANAPAATITHPALPGGHKDVGAANPGQQPAADNKNPRKVAPAVMPPADHHDPTIRQSQPAEQQKQQANQAAQQQAQAAQQQKLQQQQAAQQAKQQQQAAQKAAQQQAKAQAQQQKMQQQQAAQQARQQQQAAQKAAQQQARQQAQQQQKMQQQQAKQQQQAAQKAARDAAQRQKQQQGQQKQQTPPGN